MFEAGILPLRVLPYHHNIHILVPRRQTRLIEAVDKRHVELELLQELNVQRTHATGHRSPDPSLQTHPVLADRLQHLRRYALHVGVDFVSLEIDRSVHCLHDLLDVAGDQRPDSVAGSGHAGHGSGRITL